MRKLMGGVLCAMALGLVLSAETLSKRIEFANERWIPVGLISEGIIIKEVRFEVQGGINWNPLRAGIGPQAFVALKNDSTRDMKVAVAIALFDAKNDLIAATEMSYPGTFEAGEADELKVTFRDVKRRFFEAKTAQIALETTR